MPYNHLSTLLGSPYYDDFDATKNFLQVLFKPGYAVQARELTQLQTILQNQISKVGDHLFIDGTHVYGAKISSGYYYYFTRLGTVKDSTGTTINTSARRLDEVKTLFLNKSFCTTKAATYPNFTYANRTAILAAQQSPNNSTNDLDFQIEIVDILEPTTSGSDNDGYILIYKFNKGSFKAFEDNTDSHTLNFNNTSFPVTFTEITDTNKTTLNTFLNKSNSNTQPITFDIPPRVKTGTRLDVENTNQVLTASITSGIFYKDGRFIQTPDSFFAMNKIAINGEIESTMYDGQIITGVDRSGRRLFSYPSRKIGFKITYSSISVTQDATLYDNAQGSSNYNAPGADRLNAIIEKIDETFDPSLPDSYKSKTASGDDFIELVRYKKGVIQSIKKDTEYNEILKLFAGRTYDESGSYTVQPFTLEIKEHLKKDIYKINFSAAFATTGQNIPEVGDMVFQNTLSAPSDLIFPNSSTSGSSQKYPTDATITEPIGIIRKIETNSLYVEMLNKYTFSGLSATTSMSGKRSDDLSIYTIGTTTTGTVVEFIPDNDGLYKLGGPGVFGDEDKASIIVSPGKGYVEGFKIENFNSSFVDLPKARGTDHQITDKSTVDFSTLENVIYMKANPELGSASGSDITSDYINIGGNQTMLKIFFAGVTSNEYAEGTVHSWSPFKEGNIINSNTSNSILPLINKQSVLFITSENQPIV